MLQNNTIKKYSLSLIKDNKKKINMYFIETLLQQRLVFARKIPHSREIIWLTIDLILLKFMVYFIAECWSYYKSMESLHIRNKALHKKYIDISVRILSNFQLRRDKKQIVGNFNKFFTCIIMGFKYYVAGRAHNVMWVKTRYIKIAPYSESKYNYNRYNIGTTANDYNTTRWGSVNHIFKVFSDKYI